MSTLPQALDNAKAALTSAAIELGPHVATHKGINTHVIIALERIDTAMASVYLAEPPTLTPMYDSTALQQVMHVWAKS